MLQFVLIKQRQNNEIKMKINKFRCFGLVEIIKLNRIFVFMSYKYIFIDFAIK